MMMLEEKGQKVVISDSCTSDIPATESRVAKEGRREEKLPQSSTVNLVTPNTFVVRLKPAGNDSESSTDKESRAKGEKSNLLRFFYGKAGSNVSIVKALGLGKIVVKKSMLDKPKCNIDASNVYKKSQIISHEKNLSMKLATTASPKIGSNGYKSNFVAKPKHLSAARNEGGRQIYTREQSQHHSYPQQKRKSWNGDIKVKVEDSSEFSDNLSSFMNFSLNTLVNKPVKSPLREVGRNFSYRNADVYSFGKRSRIAKKEPMKETNSNPKEFSSIEHLQALDDDLTSLSWLCSDKSLIKTIRQCNPDDAGISLSGDESDGQGDGKNSINPDDMAIFTAKSKVEGTGQVGYSDEHGAAYNPKGKPPYSFSCLIFMAIEDSDKKMLPVKDIYTWVCKHFPYFQTAPAGWKNSIRHNLSLNKCFKKAEGGYVELVPSHEQAKGSLWCIDPAYRPNLIQALKRSPYYPYLYPSGIGQPLSLNNLASLLPSVRSGRIPMWSPYMSASTDSAWADPDVASAALNLLGLKKNDISENQNQNVKSTLMELTEEMYRRVQTMNQSSQESTIGMIPLIITDPSEDHTYTSTPQQNCKNERCETPESVKSAPDAAYEFETCGTDMDSDIADTVSIDGSGAFSDQNKQEIDLGDSGFASLRSHPMPKRNRRSLQEKNAGKRKKPADHSPPAKQAKQSCGWNGKSKSQSKRLPKKSKKTLKVDFQNHRKSKSIQSKPMKLVKKELLTSDDDSGKDSPKPIKKTRSVFPRKQNFYSKTYKSRTKAAENPGSPYGTRSNTLLERKKKADECRNRRKSRRRRQSITCIDVDDEVKLAAGSLLHLAGFRSSSSNE